MFGVWKTKFEPTTQKLFEQGGNKCYSYAFLKAQLIDPAGGSVFSRKLRDYGVESKEGDIVEMTLDLKQCVLSYKVNDFDYGKAFDVEKTTYRAVAALSYKESKITLVSYSRQ